MARLITHVVTVREPDDYTVDESEDDLHAALAAAGTEVVEIHLHAVRQEKPGDAALFRRPESSEAPGD